ncbi:hypothetical protein lerEdw1_012536 [Lerista edwardsae]|nr:hypothetical protein lerEdw1_012536 [Lerista edwardsae]
MFKIMVLAIDKIPQSQILYFVKRETVENKSSEITVETVCCANSVGLEWNHLSLAAEAMIWDMLLSEMEMEVERSQGCEICSVVKVFFNILSIYSECGFGYGEDAQCMTCRPNRFKEDWGFQKCKPCLDCALVNRFQKANCSATSNAICGDCLPGFYRKTKLGGFQDMECVPCGDPPPPYEPHCKYS